MTRILFSLFVMATAGTVQAASLDCYLAKDAEKIALKKSGEVLEGATADGLSAMVRDISENAVFVGYGWQLMSIEAKIVSRGEILSVGKFTLYTNQSFSFGSPEAIVSCSLID